MPSLLPGLAVEGIALFVEETPGLESGCTPSICQMRCVSLEFQDGVLGVEDRS